MNFQYGILFNNPLFIMTYGALGLAIISLWIKRKPLIWGNLLVLAALMGTLCSRLEWPALLFMVLFGSLCYFTYRIKNFELKIICGIFVFILSILLWFHKVPGFSNWLIAKRIYLNENALPYSLYLNFDKPLIGLFLLGFGTLPLLKSKKELFKMALQSLPIAFLGFVLIIGIAILLGYVEFEPKWSSFFFIWAFENLVLSTISEEVLFRGFVQHSLSQAFKKLYLGNIFSILIAAVIFGTVHTGGVKYQFLAVLAGVVYGCVFHYTKKIEASILTHFLLNCVHFILFTYPALAGSF